MRIKMRCLGWMLSLSLGLLVVASASASEMGHVAADQVDADQFYNLLDNWLFTHAGDNRGPDGPDLVPCRDNIAFLFQQYGLDVTIEPFTYWGDTYHNVVGTKWGTLYPDQEFVIGAHYDSVSNPGADDNASGTALVIEAARILSQYESDYTIRFVAFSMEEVGLVGSEAYVDAHINDDIIGMISADMVAYDTGSNAARVYQRSNSPIADALEAAIAEYGNGLSSIDPGWISASDHAPFDAAGFDACLLIEAEVWDNPFYHTQQDNLDNPNNINVDFAVRMVRSAVGMLVDEAGVLVDADILTFDFPDGLPEYSQPHGGTAVRVTVGAMGDAVAQPGSGMLHYNVGLGWESEPMQVVEENVYDAFLPAQTCGEQVQYYFSAETTDGDVFLSPRTAPAASHTARAAYGRSIVFEETFDTNPGWTTQGLWAYGQPSGSGGQYGGPDPTSGFTGPNVYGYNLNGDYENNLPERHLTSTAIDCSGIHDIQLEFMRWLGVEQPAYDHAYVRISTNGTNWTTVWENTSEITDAAWLPIEIDVSDLVDDQSTVYLRWTMGTTDVGWRYCGWNIDDVRLTALDCEAPFVPGDLNCDLAVNFDDIGAFVVALGGETAYYAEYPECNWLNGDIDGNGTVDFDDITPFVNLLGG